MYTQDQLNGMNLDQLKAAVLEMQGQQGTTVLPTDTAAITETTVQATANTDANAQATPAPAASDNTSAVKTDIDKINTTIASLKQEGEELYTDAITALEAKRDALVVEAKAEINQAETEVKSIVDQFRDKYLPWIEGVAVLITLLKVFKVI